jgi:hypothetical protein
MENHFKSQLIQYYEYLQKNTATNSMVEQAIGIKQKNLTRYKVTLEDQGSLVVVYRGFCKVTGFPADYLSTNNEIIKKVNERKYKETLFP